MLRSLFGKAQDKFTAAFYGAETRTLKMNFYACVDRSMAGDEAKVCVYSAFGLTINQRLVCSSAHLRSTGEYHCRHVVLTAQFISCFCFQMSDFKGGMYGKLGWMGVDLMLFAWW